MKAWCARRQIAYADEGQPIPLDTFLAYANWFQKRYVPDLEEVNVASLEQASFGFLLTLADGAQVAARHVVMAVGITWFASTPDILSQLPEELATHSSQHRDVSRFKGRKVAVIGAGSSAIDLAHLLHEEGASVRIVARTPVIEYNKVPDAADDTLLGRIQRPASGIGRGWRSLFCAEAPLMFYRLPQSIRRRAIESHMHPAAGWFMREKMEGIVPMLLGRSIANAWDHQGRAHLTLSDAGGKHESLVVDHVISATGYRTDMRRVPLPLARALRRDRAQRSAPRAVGQFRDRGAGPVRRRPRGDGQFRPVDALHGRRGVRSAPGCRPSGTKTRRDVGAARGMNEDWPAKA